MQRFSFPSFGSQNSANAKAQADFKENGKPQAEAPKPVEKTYPEAELEQAKAEAFKAGHEQGMKEGLEKGAGEKIDLDKKISMLLADIQASVTNVLGSFDQIFAEKTGEVIGVITAICKKVAGDAMREFPQAKIETVVKNCLQMLMNHDEVNIIVNDKILSQIENKITELGADSGFKGKIHLKGDAALANTDCRIEWQNGAATHDTEKLWQEVDRLLQNMMNKTPDN